MQRKRSRPSWDEEIVAGNGLVHRRAFLTGGAALATAMSGYTLNDAEAAPLPVEPWMQIPTLNGFDPYGKPSRFESKVVREPRPPTAANGLGSIRTPLHLLNGTITPNGLHFVRLHSGVPDIDPDKHKLLIHGLVERPLIFTLDALAKYPMESRIYFLECGGNSQTLYQKDPIKAGVQRIHGQVCSSDWTGVRLSTLLEEAGVKPNAKWIVAEGADASGMARSVPLSKIMDDALIALYQNGERLRPENGYPMRLFLPGYQGNANVEVRPPHQGDRRPDAYPRRDLALFDPARRRQDAAVLPADGCQVGHHPSRARAQAAGTRALQNLWTGLERARPRHRAQGRGLRRRRQELGRGGIPVAVLPKALVRFQMPWRWDGRPVVLQSRCTDDTGYVQWTRAAMIAERGLTGNYMPNCITSWAVNDQGEVNYVYA